MYLAMVLKPGLQPFLIMRWHLPNDYVTAQPFLEGCLQASCTRGVPKTLIRFVFIYVQGSYYCLKFEQKPTEFVHLASTILKESVAGKLADFSALCRCSCCMSSTATFTCAKFPRFGTGTIFKDSYIKISKLCASSGMSHYSSKMASFGE